MSPRKRSEPRRLPVEYPSVPDSQSAPGKHDEPDVPAAADRVPASTFSPSARGSRAELRLRVEELLRRKESAQAGAWAELGDEARELLVELLDDEAVRSDEAMRHRAIAVLGQLEVQRSVPALSAILADSGEGTVTKAFAVGALGRIGNAAAVHALVPLVTAEDDMLRRQVEIALSRADRPAVIPHLLVLDTDASGAVSEVAAEALGRWEQKLGRKLTRQRKTRARKQPTKKTLPSPER